MFQTCFKTMALFDRSKTSSDSGFAPASDHVNDRLNNTPWATPSDEIDDAAASFYSSPDDNTAPFGESAPNMPSSSNSNVLNSDVTVIGTLRFTEDLLVDGIVEGEIVSDGVLTVGANAKISGTDKNQPAICTKSAIIHGKVFGNVVVTDRIELSSSAELQGDVTANSIAIQEGAKIVGHVQVGASLGISMPVKTASTAPKRSPKRTASSPNDDTSNLLV